MKTHTDERGLTRFFLEPKDAKSPDEPHYLHQLGLSSKEAIQRINGLPDGFLDNLKNKALIDKGLLQEIRDLITLCTLIDKSGQCKALRDKLDKIYPFLC